MVAALESRSQTAASDEATSSSSSSTTTSGGLISGSAEDGVRFDGVTVYSPDGRLLVRDVTFALKPGQNLFVTVGEEGRRPPLVTCHSLQCQGALPGRSDTHVVYTR